MKIKNGALATGAVATLAAFGLLAGVAGAQNAQPTQSTTTDTTPHPTRIAGKVDKVDATAGSLTITNPKGSTAVSVSSNTWVLVEKDGKCAQGSISDLVAGNAVTVTGMTTTTPNQVNARTVIQGACFAGKVGGKAKGNARAAAGKLGAIADHMAAGTIKSVSGTTIVVTNQRGTDVTVNTTASTVVLNGGFKDATTLKAGDKVQVLGKPEAKAAKPATGQQPARTIDAWGIRVVSDNVKLFSGRVDKIDGNTITIKTRTGVGVSTITLNGSTGFKAATVMDRAISVTSAVQGDIKAGSLIMVEGTTGADSKSVNADAVIILPAANAKATKKGLR